MVSICAIERGCEICYDSVEWEDALGNDKAMGMEISYILFKKCSNLNETHLPQEAYIVKMHHKKFHLEMINTGPRNSISNLPISHGFKLWNRWNCSASWHKTSLYSANRNDNKVTNYEMRIIEFWNSVLESKGSIAMIPERQSLANFAKNFVWPFIPFT